MSNHDSFPQVAILISTSNNWGRQIVEGILEYMNEAGPWHIWVSDGFPYSNRELPKGWRGDGIIGGFYQDERTEKIKAFNLPVVNVADHTHPTFPTPSVRTDDTVGTQIAVQHFVDRGFKNLAVIVPDHSPNPRWYRKAFEQAAKDQGLDCHVLTLEGTGMDADERIGAWLLNLPHPTGLLVWGHGLSRKVVDNAIRAGISVPHDLAILGGSYDDLLCHACFPSLSGVLAPTKQIGYKCAQLLDKMMRGEQVPNETVYLPPLGIKEKLSTDTLAIEDPQLIQVVEYLKVHAYESITMKDILTAVPMARRSLERRFQKVFGRSPIDEIRRLRIDRARKLLIDSNLPMQEIAESCGYATYNYLTHVFKEETGMTPRSYRKQYRQ